MTKTHMMRKTPEYGVWVNMRTRCNNTNYYKWNNYGGRGIKVCEEWNGSFEQFFADMGKRPSNLHSLDRIDNDGNYCKENCRWATRKEQQANRSPKLGVSWHKRILAWGVEICRDGVRHHLGYFDTKEEAATAYRKMADAIDAVSK
jgi:hypothetical protein